MIIEIEIIYLLWVFAANRRYEQPEWYITVPNIPGRIYVQEAVWDTIRKFIENNTYGINVTIPK